MFQGYKGKLAFGLGVGALGVVVTMVVIAMAGAARPADRGSTANRPEEDSDSDAIQVTTVRPRFDPNFTATVEQPAYVNAYYEDDLQARAAGPVKFLKKAIGAHVTKGEKLLEVDVPDVRQDVVQKAAIIEQRRKELKVAEASVRVAQAAVTTAENNVREKEAYVEAKEAWRDFKLKEYNRFYNLANSTPPAATRDVVDERWKDYLVAKADKTAAEVAVQKAKSDLLEATEKLEIARADVELKQSLIKVAEEDHNRAKEILGLATLEAPFDGVITRRNINPGGFVHNASSTANAKPLLRVERIDIVTVYMKVPDKYVSFINEDTEALIHMNALPGYLIRGKVTRYSDSLESEEKDRTMRVEVDLYNGSRQEYDKFLEKEKAGQEDLKSGPLPLFPMIEGGNPAARPRLKPGMYGTMTLVLRKFNNAMLLPMSAVVPRGGKNYVFIVKDGLAQLVPISVDVENGKVAKVTLLSHDGTRETVQEFTGKEEVVNSNQGELSDGQKVTPTRTSW
jgi:multidrug efflux pump subunit AcrA (membrane-fusion protein)